PIRAAVRRRRVLRPWPGSQHVAALAARRPPGGPAGHTRTPRAIPAHRPGPDAIAGKPGDQPCGPPGLALPGPGCYPQREQLPAPPPGGPPPGPPAIVPAAPTPSAVFEPAPGEVAPAPAPTAA